MRDLVNFLFVLFVSSSFAQEFEFRYSEIPLGSNHHFYTKTPIISATDTILSCQFIYREVYQINDSAEFWETEEKFTRSDVLNLTFNSVLKDSIQALLNPMLGKAIFATDPYVSSGGSQLFYFEFNRNCIQYQLTNTNDSLINSVIKIINTILPDSFDIYIMPELDHSEFAPIIEHCPANPDSNPIEILGRQWDILNEKKN